MTVRDNLAARASRLGLSAFAPTPTNPAERLAICEVDGVRVTEARHPANGLVKPHAHAAWTLSVLLAGACEETALGRRVALAGCGAVARGARCIHSDVFGAEGARFLHLEIVDPGRTGCDGFMQEWVHIADPRIMLLAAVLRPEMRNTDQAAELACESLVDEILVAVSNACVRRRPLSHVALAAGFYEQSHLTRWLQREAGTTPARLRNAPHT